MSNDILVPNIGDFNNVEIIEVLIKEGQEIEKGDTVITLESDKSSVEVPSSMSGTVKVVHIKIGDKVSEGSLISSLEVSEYSPDSPSAIASETETRKEVFVKKNEENELKTSKDNEPLQVNAILDKSISSQPILQSAKSINISGASPKIMKFARELGISVNEIDGSGRKGRILEQDIKNYVIQNLNKDKSHQTENLNTKPKANELDSLPYQHNEFGDVDIQTIPRIKKMSGPHLVKAWNTIPHVTQHDELDITEMESFRKGLVDLNTREKISITPLAFMMKALVNAMQKFPNFNSSLDQDKVIYKKYFHVGIAVDTPHGLMVPKIRDVNKKSLSELSKEVRSVSKLCKELKIDKKEFFGGSITISSLGGIGGSFFTPIINSPEVAIIGIGKSEIKPVFINEKFKPRMMMPISLSYDHRIVDGAEAAKFCQDLKISLGRNFSMKLVN
jgi:pyruvate dehydrogenase E2 component (dihydrolipoamide acetyltransferase)